MSFDGREPRDDALPRTLPDAIAERRSAIDELAVDGLLRQLGATPEWREQRVASILEGVERGEPRRRYGALVAASVVALAVLALFWFPSTDANVLDAAIAELGDAIDRRVAVTITRVSAGGRVATAEGEMVCRAEPGERTRLFCRFDGAPLGALDVGSDGRRTWWRSRADPTRFGEFPAGARRRVAGLLPVEILDLRRVVRALRRADDVVLEARREGSVRRVRARVPVLHRGGAGGVRDVEATFDRDRRRLERLRLEVFGPGGRAALRVEFELGERVAVDPAVYERPW